MEPSTRLLYFTRLVFQATPHNYLYSAGFLERDMALKNPFKDFGQSTMVVAMSYGPTFSYKYRYPGNLTVRTGADFWAAQYLSQALNFKLQ